MKILVIPDVHETNYWEKALEYGLKNNYDKIIQVGDWFDAWEHDWTDDKPVKNFLKAVEEAKKNDKFDILLGNHDFSYLTHDTCSGYQAFQADKIRKALISTTDYVNVAKEYDGWVFSHAGVSTTWAKRFNVETVEDINDIFHNKTVKFAILDQKFKDEVNIRYPIEYWIGIGSMIAKEKPDDVYKIHRTPSDLAKIEIAKDWMRENYGANDYIDMQEVIRKAKAFSFCGFNCYGDDVTQGPLWIRPSSLFQDAFFKKQCVGHTEYTERLEAEDYKLLVIDSRGHKVFTEIDTETDISKPVDLGL